jgi:hypothetical protein
MSMKLLIFSSSHCTAKYFTQKSPTYAITHWKFVVGKVTVHCFVLQFTTSSGDRSVGDPNLGKCKRSYQNLGYICISGRTQLMLRGTEKLKMLETHDIMVECT